MKTSWWLTPVILAAQEAEIRRIIIQSKQFEKTHHRKGLVEWLKVVGPDVKSQYCKKKKKKEREK
jgi:hypothetical protein